MLLLNEIFVFNFSTLKHTHSLTPTHPPKHTQLEIKGYNHKQAILLSKITDQMTGFTVDPKRFAIHKERILRSLRNFKAEQPHQHAMYYAGLLLDSLVWTKEQLAEGLEGWYRWQILNKAYASLVPRPSLTALFTAVEKTVGKLRKKIVRKGLGTRLGICNV